MMSNHVTIRIQKKAIVLSCSYSYHSNIPYVDGVGFRSAAGLPAIRIWYA